MNSSKMRVAVMISGRGSNMKALVEAAQAPDYPAKIVLVISNRIEAAGLEYASSQNITAIAIDGKDFANRAAHEQAIHKVLVEHRIELICLAGYMRILDTEFVDKWSGKILNIHPSLLPKYPGLNTHQRALDAGDKVHGCTVHIVTSELDGGPIILQSQVPILENDNADSLTARVLKAEHLLYPKALAMVAGN